MLKTLSFSAYFILFLIFYIYVGYPLLAAIIARFFSAPSIKKSPIRPHVSFIISCYNEEAIIRKKIENTLSLEYPKDKLDILVVSDASNDGTDDIVRKYESKGVRLIRQDERLGKTLGLNLAVPQAIGEIIVFSDANAMYQSDAIINLVENFNDETVGYVVGEAKYSNAGRSQAGSSENTYWRYEIQLKKFESSIHSIVGGDGAIYAIRKKLYKTLKSTDINDFVNPLQIIASGYRGIYQPSAICYEEAAGEFEKEFQRKTRIVNRSFSGFLQVKSVLNPFKTGLFSLQILSHKILRWFSGFFLMMFFILSIILSFYDYMFFQIIFFIELLFLSLAYLGHLLVNSQKSFKPLYYSYYFILVNIAAVNGILQSLKGSVQVTWEHHRINGKTKSDNKKHNLFINGIAIILMICFLVNIEKYFSLQYLTWRIIFFSAFLLLFYTYWGYPLVIYLWTKYFPDPITKSPITPSVTLFISAYNEEEVISKKIENCLNIDYPQDLLKIVIASDGSNDRTVEIARKYEHPCLEIIDFSERSGKIGVVNKVVPSLSGEIIVFSDANTMFMTDSIKNLIRNFADPKVGAVSADVILESGQTSFGRGESFYYRYERFIQEKESQIDSIIGADGGMYAIRRQLFIPPENDTIIDDFVISMNVAISGYRLVYEGEAKGYEGNTNTYYEEFLRKSRVIAGAYQVMKTGQGVPRLSQAKLFFCFFSHKLLRWLTPVLLVLLFVSNLRLVLAGFTNGYLILLIAELIFLFLAIIGFTVKHRISNYIFNVPFYFCLENIAALFGIYKGLFDKQTVKWKTFKRSVTETNP